MCWLVYNVFFYLYKFLLMLVVIMNKFTLLFLEGRIDFTLKTLTKSELMGRMLSLVLSNFVIAMCFTDYFNKCLGPYACCVIATSLVAWKTNQIAEN